jgi:hypothetical protein
MMARLVFFMMGKQAALTLIVMTLHTQRLLATQFKLIREISALGVVAGDTGHHLTIAGVADLLPHRVAKGPLALMTAAANLIAIALEHGWGITPMGLMTDHTLSDLGVARGVPLMPGQGILMAAETDLLLTADEEHAVIAGMGTMAAHATIAAGAVRQVRVDQGVILGHLVMTRQADPGRYRLISLMTRSAPLPERVVQPLPEHALGVAAVGAVAGETPLDRDGE